MRPFTPVSCSVSLSVSQSFSQSVCLPVCLSVSQFNSIQRAYLIGMRKHTLTQPKKMEQYNQKINLWTGIEMICIQNCYVAFLHDIVISPLPLSHSLCPLMFVSLVLSLSLDLCAYARKEHVFLISLVFHRNWCIVMYYLGYCRSLWSLG